jgi:hypothetical protein
MSLLIYWMVNSVPLLWQSEITRAAIYSLSCYRLPFHNWSSIITIMILLILHFIFFNTGALLANEKKKENVNVHWYKIQMPSVIWLNEHQNWKNINTPLIFNIICVNNANISFHFWHLRNRYSLWYFFLPLQWMPLLHIIAWFVTPLNTFPV